MAFARINPSTGETLATFEKMGPAELHQVLDGAAGVFLTWKESGFPERARHFRRAGEILKLGQEKYARLMAQEMGKPISQGKAEIQKCARCCDFYAENAERFLSPQTPATDGAKSRVAFRPLGVILAVMPWNFPFWQVFRFAVPTLAAGNAAVLKHASNVFGCALEIEKIFQEAGFPGGLFQSLLIGPPDTTPVILDPRIAAVSITGSVGAGRAVASEAGKALKKCVLELGGSDPFIVLADADLEKAVEVGVQARFQNAGQSCIAAKRFILVEAIREEFENRFVERTRQLKMGDPLDPQTEIGPMARRDLRDELHRQVVESVERGARLRLGGPIPEGPGAFYPPTILTDVKKGMPAFSEELFGPVAAMISVKNEEEAIAVANATEFGLGASIWTRDLARGERLATERIEAGSCFVNGMVKSDPRLPFGGIKHSGYGRELGEFGIHEFVNIKTVVISGS